jgi:prolyl-tRNA editing enzyme YbaK/EbsC (Cys-tRNA(Pro) deacylase)
MTEDLHARALEIQKVLDQHGVRSKVVTMPSTTRTAADAAAAIGCAVGQIAKSLVFRAVRTSKPVLVIASGANRVNEAVIAQLVGEPLETPKADFVRALTGYAIGGVPPLGFPQPIDTFIDEDLLQFSEIWAAAGTPNAVFCIDPGSLVTITRGTVTRVVEHGS